MATPSLQPGAQSGHVGRSIAALLAGLVAGIVLSVGTDALMYALGVLPRLGQPVADKPLMLATAYRSLYSVLASYLAARLAPGRPMAHAMTLGVIGFVVSLAGAVLTWNRQPPLGPHWYPVALIVLALPLAWVGGKLRTSRADRR